MDGCSEQEQPAASKNCIWRLEWGSRRGCAPGLSAVQAARARTLAQLNSYPVLHTSTCTLSLYPFAEHCPSLRLELHKTCAPSLALLLPLVRRASYLTATHYCTYSLSSLPCYTAGRQTEPAAEQEQTAGSLCSASAEAGRQLVAERRPMACLPSCAATGRRAVLPLLPPAGRPGCNIKARAASGRLLVQAALLRIRARSSSSPQGAFLCTRPAPYSRYSALDIHICNRTSAKGDVQAGWLVGWSEGNAGSWCGSVLHVRVKQGRKEAPAVSSTPTKMQCVRAAALGSQDGYTTTQLRRTTPSSKAAPCTRLLEGAQGGQDGAANPHTVPPLDRVGGAHHLQPSMAGRRQGRDWLGYNFMQTG